MTATLELALFVPVALAAAAGTRLLRQYGERRLLDLPNERSSHTRPVPRGGGVAIVVAFAAGVTALWLAGMMPWRLWTALVLLGGGVSAIGFWDDHQPLRMPLRLACHVAAACGAVWLLGPVTNLTLGTQSVAVPVWLAWLLSVAGITWLLNLYNFMDGIDGIAAGETCAVALGATVLFSASGVPAPGLLLLCGAALGFLIFNWSPARIFMGDAGSGFLGFVFGVFLLASSPSVAAGVWVWLILLAAFWVDATVTLLRRLARGKRWYVAHRTHAYQHAARRIGAHGPVAAVYVALTLLVLVPLAWLAIRVPDRAFWLTLVAVTPLALAAAILGAGTDE
jgi:glycosyltransferase WbpL